MADTREGEDRAVDRPEGKSHEKEEGSAPEIHPQGSLAQGGPSLGTSSSKRGDLPDSPKKREKRSARIKSSLLSLGGRAAAAAVSGFLLDQFSEKHRKHPDAIQGGEEGSFTRRHSETRQGSSVIKSPPRDSGLTQGGDLVGLHGPKEQLIKLLLEDNSGTTDVLVRGGSGMTTLVRKVCEDVCAREEHFGAIAWISVPQINDSELIHEEILLQLLFENTDHQEVKYFTYSSEYNKARCLIVVDNLVDPRSQKAFEEVSSLFETCKVIFMARRKGAINTYGRQCKIYELEDLFVEEPRADILTKKSPEGDFPSPLKEVCRLIVKKFESPPEAIVLHLHNRKERNDGWAPMLLPSDNLPSLNLSSFNLIRKVLEILSNDNRLFCLLYLSIFLENGGFSCKRVSRLWAAEGFLPDLGEAEDFFNTLLKRKFIHPVEERSDGELSTFRVDNLVREIIDSLSNYRNLVSIPSQGSTNWPESIRYRSVEGTIRRALHEEKTFQFSSIFVLDVSSNEDKITASEASRLETSKTPLIPFNLKDSKVLDLRGAPFPIIPDALFELTDATYLSLRDTSIEVIPGSIRKLLHLEFLDAKHSLVTELPPEVARLKKIRHILIYHYKEDPLTESYNLIGFKTSCRVGEFSFLEELCFVEADKSTLKDLGNLTKLRRLGITKLKKEHGELLCTSLGQLKELKSLNVHALDEDEILDLHYRTSPPESESQTSPPKSLKHLYLHGRLEKLPDWISSLDGLTKIILRWSHLEEDLLATLGELQNLVELELRRAYDGEQLDFKKKQFPKLKILLLEELEWLRSMSLEREALPSLESLTINRCQWLEEIPSDIEHIPEIRKLAFFDMSHEFYEKVKADHGKDNYQKFKDIKEVNFTRRRAGSWETHPFPADEGDEGFAGEH